MKMTIQKIISAITLLMIPFSSGLSQNNKELDWTSYSGNPVVEQKVKKLLSRMTLHDKIGQMTLYASPGQLTTGSRVDPDMEAHIVKGEVGSILNAFSLPVLRRLQKEAVEKSPLHIPILFGLDVVHGYHTVFPVPLAQSCSWDLPLIEQSEHIAASESAASGINWTYAPMVDIARDPRWGRVVEGAGEDPYLGSRIAEARVKGFQGAGIGSKDAIIACVKHFAAYGAAEAGRDYNTTDLSNQSLFNVYLRPYQAAVKAGVASIMSAFNDLNGVPCTGNEWLLKDILRSKWGFKGMVVTDYTAIPEMVEHRNVANEKDAAETALRAGIDMDMQGTCYLRFLEQSVKEGRITEDQINVATARILELKYLLGLFDNPYKYMDAKNQKEVLENPESMETALQLSRESIVLLKNDSTQLFPLSKKGSYTIALIGPYTEPLCTIGRWAGINVNAPFVSTSDGIAKKLQGTDIKIISAKGCNIEDNDTLGFDKAIATARKADVVLLLMGESDMMTGEATSRTSIRIPGMQEALISKIASLKKPTGLVLFNGRPLDLTVPSSQVNAILDTWFLGNCSGSALADVIFGDYNPSGKTTLSFPRNVGQIPVYYNHKNTGRPARADNPFENFRSNYHDGVLNSPLYCFGHGLSYTTFRISNVSIDRTSIANTDSVKVTCSVQNTGHREGSTIIQLYIRDCVSSPTRPVKELAGFQRIHLDKGESRPLTFTLRAKDLGIYDDHYQPIAPKGEFKVWIAQNSEDETNGTTFYIN
jgi:beta-glucosidase